MAAEFPRLFRAFDIGTVIQLCCRLYHGLQALVVARVSGVDPMVSADRLAAALGLDTLEQLLVLEHTDYVQQCLGLIPGAVHVFGAKAVGLKLHIATEAAHDFSTIHA